MAVNGFDEILIAFLIVLVFIFVVFMSVMIGASVFLYNLIDGPHVAPNQDGNPKKAAASVIALWSIVIWKLLMPSTPSTPTNDIVGIDPVYIDSPGAINSDLSTKKTNPISDVVSEVKKMFGF
jgi:hypothetical protein